MYIDQSYFEGALEIAQLGQASVVTKLNGFITRFEPIILEAALGYDFFKAFADGLNAGSDEQIEERWEDLRDGLVYANVNGVRKKFVGFFNSSTKTSPLAGFIYYEFMKEMASQNTGIGLVKAKGENSVRADVVRKPVNAFNEAAYQVRSFWEMLQADQNKAIKVYPEFKPEQVQSYNYGVYWPFGNNELYSFHTKNVYGI